MSVLVNNANKSYNNDNDFNSEAAKTANWLIYNFKKFLATPLLVTQFWHNEDEYRNSVIDRWGGLQRESKRSIDIMIIQQINKSCYTIICAITNLYSLCLVLIIVFNFENSFKVIFVEFKKIT